MDNKLYHLLFIDDDKDFLRSMSMAMSSTVMTEKEGVEIETHYISDPNEGISFTQELSNEQETLAVIVSDQQMPELTGIEFMEQASQYVPQAIKVLLTGYASLDSAKYAINNQILDQYVSKPIEDYDNFATIIRNAIETYHLREEKVRAEREIKQYVRELEETNEKIRSMHLAAERIAYLAQGFRKLDLDEVFELIVNKLPTVFNARYSSLFLLDENKNSLQMVKSNYLKENYSKPLNLDDNSPMMVALRQNKVLVMPTLKDAGYEFLDKDCLGNSCIIVPFVIGGDQSTRDVLGDAEEVRGVLNMGNIADMEAEDIVNYSASLIRNILGINIMNARLYQKTQKLALIDGLTGLYNKHIFMEFLKKECDYSERHGTSFYLSIFDVDDFKSINDTHGHRIGDEVLNQIGILCKSAARKSDIIARFGGEEFSWLIHRGEVDNIVAILERLREEVCNSEFPESIRTSISIGLTQFYPQRNDSMEKLIDRADEALYRAKAQGKNRVEVSFLDDNKE